MKIKEDNSEIPNNKFTKPPPTQYQNYQNVYPQPMMPMPTMQRPNYSNYNQNYASNQNQNQNDKG